VFVGDRSLESERKAHSRAHWPQHRSDGSGKYVYERNEIAAFLDPHHAFGAAGQIVTREEIRQKLWPAETFVDFDHGAEQRCKSIARDAARLRKYANSS
jgi:hypothetical protein